MVFRLFKSKYDSLMDYIDELRFKIIYFFDEDIYDYISETKLYMLFILVPNVLLIICTLGFIPSSLARYIYFFLCIYSIYNTATFFSRSRIYQIFDDSSRVLDEIYEGSTTSSSSNSSSTGNSNHLGTCFDESSNIEKYFQGNFFRGRPRARAPNLTRSIHPRFTEKYNEEHAKYGVFMRFLLLIVNIIESVFHFFTFGFLRNDDLGRGGPLRGKRRVSRRVNDKKPKRKTFSERKEEEEKNNRPANMTSYYDDMEPNMNGNRRSSLNGKKYIYEIEMWDYSQYDRALVTYFSPIQVFAMFFIYYLYSQQTYSVLYTKIIMTIFIYLQSVFIDRIMIAFERRESDKQIIYGQTYREEVDFNNKLNEKRREAIRNYNEQLLHSGVTLPTLEPVHFANAAYSGLGEMDDEMSNELLTSIPRNSYMSQQEQAIQRTGRHDVSEPKEQITPNVTKRANRKINRQSEEIEVTEQPIQEFVPPISQQSISQPSPLTSNASTTTEEPQKQGWFSGLWNSIFPSRKQKREAQAQQSISRNIQRTQTIPKDEEEDERREVKRKQPTSKQPKESEKEEEKKRKESVSNPFQQHRKKPKQ